MGHGFGCGDGNCIDWHKWHFVRLFSAVLWLSSLKSVRSCVATMVSVLDWASLGCSFLVICVSVLLDQKMIERRRKAKTSPAGLLGLILAP